MKFNLFFVFILVNCTIQLVLFGADYGGSNLIPNDNDILSGTFTNVGLFKINSGSTIHVDQNVTLNIEAQNVVIEGSLIGIGKGYLGAEINVDTGADGLDGEGPGRGYGGPFLLNDPGGVLGNGGGGAGYHGMGGNSSAFSIDFLDPGLGGEAYSDLNSLIAFKGSGGGSGCNAEYEWDTYGGVGGNGGGAIYIRSTQWINITNGLIDVSGDNGGVPSIGIVNDFGGSGGGGGSGGTILLYGYINAINSNIKSDGGDGGDGIYSIEPIGESGGGGGSGGVVRIVGDIYQDTGTTITVNGGIGGMSHDIDGVAGFIDSHPGDPGVANVTLYTITANSDNVGGTAYQQITIDILSNDVSSPTEVLDIDDVDIVVPANGGTITTNSNALVYTSSLMYSSGSDEFTYKLCRQDVKLICDTATVTITLTYPTPTSTSSRTPTATPTIIMLTSTQTPTKSVNPTPTSLLVPQSTNPPNTGSTNSAPPTPTSTPQASSSNIVRPPQYQEPPNVHYNDKAEVIDLSNNDGKVENTVDIIFGNEYDVFTGYQTPSQVIGSINVPQTIIDHNSFLVIEPSDNLLYYNRRRNNIASHVIDLTLFDSEGREISTFQEEIEICLTVNSDLIDLNDYSEDECSDDGVNTSCLSYLNTKNEWECQDQDLRVKKNQLCGKTDHFSSFAILLDATSGKNCSEDGYFTGSLVWDIVTMLSLIVVLVLAGLFLFVSSMFVKPVRRFVYGKEGNRVMELRTSERLSRSRSRSSGSFTFEKPRTNTTTNSGSRLSSKPTIITMGDDQAF